MQGEFWIESKDEEKKTQTKGKEKEKNIGQKKRMDNCKVLNLGFTDYQNVNWWLLQD